MSVLCLTGLCVSTILSTPMIRKLLSPAQNSLHSEPLHLVPVQLRSPGERFDVLSRRKLTARAHSSLNHNTHLLTASPPPRYQAWWDFTKLLLGLGNSSVHWLSACQGSPRPVWILSSYIKSLVRQKVETGASLELESQSRRSRFSDRPCLRKSDGDQLRKTPILDHPSSYTPRMDA